MQACIRCSVHACSPRHPEPNPQYDPKPYPQAQGGGGFPSRKTEKILCQRVCLIGGQLTVQPHAWNPRLYPALGHPLYNENLFLRDDGSAPPWDALGGHCPRNGCIWEARCLLNKINICVKNAAYSESKCAGCSGTACKKLCPQFICSARKTIKCVAILLAGQVYLYNRSNGKKYNQTRGNTPVARYSKAQRDECAYHRDACRNVGMVL